MITKIYFVFLNAGEYKDIVGPIYSQKEHSIELKATITKRVPYCGTIALIRDPKHYIGKPAILLISAVAFKAAMDTMEIIWLEVSNDAVYISQNLTCSKRFHTITRLTQSTRISAFLKLIV